MQVIIPMSGFGERFRVAGYDVPKPLIVVEEKTIIQHVVEMFSDKDEFIFICNEDHLSNEKYEMRNILEKISKNGKIFSIKPHKLGPVYAVMQVLGEVDLQKPVVVNYCDFTCYWSYDDFKDFAKNTNADGIIPGYRGFHPHTLWSNYYAYVEESNSRASNIQEKKPFTNNPTSEFASSGTYYFKTGSLMKKYFQRCMDDSITVGGEYYASMSYKPMMQDGLNVRTYEIQHFMQWGTPEDLREYQYWSNIFRNISKKQKLPKHNGALLLPMAGLGSRFQNKGYQIPKPLIDVSGLPMAIQALTDLPSTKVHRCVVRGDMQGLDQLVKALDSFSNKVSYKVLDHATNGQALTCIEGAFDLDMEEPVTIAACDNGMIYDADLFNNLMQEKDVDVIVWGARGYPGSTRNPKAYGWIDVVNEAGNISKISVKKPLENPEVDPIVVGAFTFKKLKYFFSAVSKMKERRGIVNGEYYVDTSINDSIEIGLKCKMFEIDYYVCWGTPDDLKTFEYWQSCFHKWKSHPYSLETDNNIPKDKVNNLKVKYAPITPIKQ